MSYDGWHGSRVHTARILRLVRHVAVATTPHARLRSVGNGLCAVPLGELIGLTRVRASGTPRRAFPTECRRYGDG